MTDSTSPTKTVKRCFRLSKHVLPHSCSNGEATPVALPIIVLNLAVPGSTLRLSLNSETLVQSAGSWKRTFGEGGTREFGMCAPDGKGGPVDVGTLLRITGSETLRDGRTIMLARGVRRFRVLSLGGLNLRANTGSLSADRFSSNRHYPSATVEWLDDVDEVEGEQEDEMAQQVRKSFEVLHDKYLRELPNNLASFFLRKLYSEDRFTGLVRALQRGRFETVRQITAEMQLVQEEEDHRSWCWRALNSLPLMDIGRKIEMMRMTSASKRLRMLGQLVEELRSAQQKTKSIDDDDDDDDV